MRQVILGAAIAVMLAGGQPALAQSNPFRPVVYVNDFVVTEFDIQQRQRFLQLLGAPDTDRAAAEKAVIEDRLRMDAGKKLDIRPKDEDVEAAITEFAGRGGLSIEQFGQLLSQNGIDAQIFRDFIVSGVVWREVVRARVVPTVQINDAEVEQEFQRIAATPRVTGVLLSELIIPAPPGQEQQALQLGEQIAANTRNESDFAAAARQYSATQSREQGGRLPWASLDNLPPSLRPILLSMQPGQVSQPLTVEGAVVLFMLRDTRGTVRPGARDQVLEFIRLRLGSAEQAAQIASVTRNCGDLFVQARNLPEQQLIHDTLPQSAIPSDIAVYLSSLDADETSVVNTGVGADIVMLCKRTPALLAEPDEPVTQLPAAPGQTEPAATPDPDALPARDQVRDMLFNRKINNAAEAYLAELRANAILRR